VSLRRKYQLLVSFASPFTLQSLNRNPFLIFSECIYRRVIALDTSGNEIFSSVSLTGVGAGSPVTSFDGRHIYLTLNSALKTVGHFSILDVFRLEQDPSTPGSFLPLSPIFFATNETNPFGPIGIFKNPSEGYYDGGELNQNDMLVWAFDTAGDATAAGNGAMFGYQQPVGYAFDGVGLEVLELGGLRDWQASTAPVLTNSGRSMYWSNSRASVRCWVGSANEDQNRFSRGRTNTASFARGNPAFISAYASPALSSNAVTPMVYGPGAANQFYMTDTSLGNALVITTDSLIYSPAKVSPDDQYVYYVTENGLLYQADATTLAQRWVATISGRVEGDIAMNSAGTMLYVGTTSGDVYGFEIATDLDTTLTPTAAPSTSSPPPTVSAAPSSPPTTLTPTSVPTAAPSSAPTSSPSASAAPSGLTTEPTQSPVSVAPTMSPVTPEPTMAPVTLDPTVSPVTMVPTVSPVTMESTTMEPTRVPTTDAPTDMPSGAMSGAVVSISALVFSIALLAL
jgi:hypothetical protein